MVSYEMLVAGALAAVGFVHLAIFIERMESSRSKQKCLPQIHQEEYPLQLKIRHEADVEEFSNGLDKVTKFYFKMVFTPQGPPAESLKAFLKLIGGEDQSNMDFEQLAAYLKIEKSKRYVLVTSYSSVVWKTSAGATRYALLSDISGGFEWSKFFHLIGVAKACGFSFRRVELIKREQFGCAEEIDVHMHFTALPTGGV